ncbi:2Fe-2S iron-sulfur cluster-binding protein [Robiginitalea sp. IMCC43444]|uniref:2Fe-2S iron-sulfur cluster-binding protein n=1 Tax=Robiginitalea sp. IMCC43444 TaxID=3459121 RepID=UPI00404385B2
MSKLEESAAMLSFAAKFAKKMSSFYPLEVSNIDKLTPNSVAVSLQIPAEHREAFRFDAGQYITIRHKNGDSEIRRAYSISSAPRKEELTIGIKKVKGGTFSVYANEQLQTGDVLEVMPPEGRFVLKPDSKYKNVLAFAAGSGITPIMSILRTALQDRQDLNFVLVFGNQNREETMFYKDLQDLKEKYNDRFHLYHLFSRNQESDSLFGRIENSTVNYVLRNKHKSVDFDAAYLCGPLPMIDAVRDSLKANGMTEDRIFHELFTEPEAEASSETPLEGTTRLEVTLDDEIHQLEMDQKSLVLDVVLNAKIDAPYSCQGGVCSTCIARVTEGSAHMEKNQILTDSELQEGFILTCQAHPTSAVLKIDYDDV